MNRTCLIVSPYFPPSTLAGVHRARHLAKHLPAAGWHPIVVCVDEAYHEERLDPGLYSLVPPSVEIVRVKALPAPLTRLVGIGDISLRARSQLRKAIFRLLGTRQIDAVFITGSPYYPMLLAPEIKRRFGVPVILDFQDPWVSAWGAQQRLFSKAGISHRLAAWFEPRAVRAADIITSVSEIQNAEMVGRYEWLDSSRTVAIPIGGDPEDFVTLPKKFGHQVGGYLTPGCVNLSYVGTFMPRSETLMKVLLRGFVRFRNQRPRAAASVRLNFIGTSNQPNDSTTYRVRPLAEAEGVADAVLEFPARVPYLTALECLTQSNGILLIGSDEPHYTASKIYSGLMSRRPYLSLFHQNSSAHGILSRAGGGIALAFSPQTQLSKLEDLVYDGLVQLVTSSESLGSVDPAAYAPYEAQKIAFQYADIFDEIHEARARR
jgi:hypothetical protein